MYVFSDIKKMDNIMPRTGFQSTVFGYSRARLLDAIAPIHVYMSKWHLGGELTADYYTAPPPPAKWFSSISHVYFQLHTGNACAYAYIHMIDSTPYMCIACTRSRSWKPVSIVMQ